MRWFIIEGFGICGGRAGAMEAARCFGSRDMRRETPFACHTANCWDELEAFLFGARNGGKTPLIFLHLLRTQSGVERIVGIEPRGAGNAVPLMLVVQTCRPIRDRADRNLGGGDDEGIGRQSSSATKGRPIAFYAGQVDVHDPARFSIRFESDGGNERVDGRLMNQDERDGSFHFFDNSLNENWWGHSRAFCWTME